MKTLYVLRHAKSSWTDRDISDFDRPLNERGLAAAPFLGEMMRTENLLPEVIYSSPAKRARETALLAKNAGRIDAPIFFDDRIYEASPQTLLAVVTAIDDRFASAMMVGHNPGTEGFIRLLTGELVPMATASLAVIDFVIAEWGQIGAGSGKLRRVIRPRDEMSSGRVP
jgi:phosphohistidine phosphatase